MARTYRLERAHRGAALAEATVVRNDGARFRVYHRAGAYGPVVHRVVHDLYAGERVELPVEAWHEEHSAVVALAHRHLTLAPTSIEDTAA